MRQAVPRLDMSRLYDALASMRAEDERDDVRDSQAGQDIMHQAGGLLSQTMADDEARKRAAQAQALNQASAAQNQAFHAGENQKNRAATAGLENLRRAADAQQAIDREAGEGRRHDEMMTRIGSSAELNQKKFDHTVKKDSTPPAPRPGQMTFEQRKALAAINGKYGMAKTEARNNSGAYNTNPEAQSAAGTRSKQFASEADALAGAGGGNDDPVEPPPQPGEEAGHGPDGVIVFRRGKWVVVGAPVQ